MGTRDGFPVRHWVFPGNTVDVTTVAKVKEDLRGWRNIRDDLKRIQLAQLSNPNGRVWQVTEPTPQAATCEHYSCLVLGQC